MAACWSESRIYHAGHSWLFCNCAALLKGLVVVGRKRGLNRWMVSVGVLAIGIGLLWHMTRSSSAAGGANTPSQSPTQQADSATDVVTIGQSLDELSKGDIGVNTAVWDPQLMTRPTESLLAKAGIRLLRYPGGSTADIYHWQSNSITPSQNSYANPQNSFANFTQLLSQLNAQAMVTVNYGTGTPQEAAAWVAYAKDHGNHVKYWEIGNEVYGNGSYGTQWEVDNHSNLGPEAYAENALQYIQAMKKANPNISIGVNLVVPGQWPDGQQPDWNRTVLQVLGKSIDFVDLHWYPQESGQESDKGLLTAPQNIPSIMAQVHGLIAKYCGAHANQVQVLVGETNSVATQPGKQTVSMVNALFLAEDVMTWLQAGATSVDWWDLHNSMDTSGNNASGLYGEKQYGDYGILSSGSQSTNNATTGAKTTSSGGTDAYTTSEPPPNTPFPTYDALQLLSDLAQPGDKVLTASGTMPAVHAFAVKHRGGSVAVLLVNTDPHHATKVRVSLPNASFPITGIYSYGPGSHGVSHSYGLRTVTLQPYSMKVVIYHKWL